MSEVLRVKTGIKICRSVHEVYEAIVDPEKMSQYFITYGSGRMEEGETIRWRWEDANAECIVRVKKVELDKCVSFSWSSNNAETLVEILLEPIGESTTTVKVTETGWLPDAEGIARLAEQTQGWMHMLCCLKAFIEFGINLRVGNPRAA